MLFLKFVLVILLFQFKVFNCTPIVLWHGIGDDHLASIKRIILTNVDENVYIKSIQLGENSIEDFENGIFVHPDVQIMDVCNEIASDEKLSNGFHAVGFSQGAQFFRGLIQRCENIKVINFISLGGQHQGVFGVPACSSRRNTICKIFRSILNFLAYTKWAQNNIVPATYWHDPYHEEKYRMKSTFLADINNERFVNEDYVKRLQGLHKFVLVKFLRDKIVQPVESSWFGFYQPGSGDIVLTLTESEIYTRDKLGLQRMMRDGKIFFIEVDGEHLFFDDVWFIEKIIPFLRD